MASTMTPDSTVLFCSAVTPDRYGKAREHEAAAENALMTEHLVHFLSKHPVAQLVFLSSTSLYGPQPPDPIRESSPVNPDRPYAKNKLENEYRLTDCGQRQGFAVLHARISLLYGPGDRHNFYGPLQFFHSALKERCIYLFGQGEDRRDFLYIEDMAAALFKLIELKAHGVYLLTPGQSLSFAELAKKVSCLLPYPVELKSMPRQIPLCHHHFDNTRLCSALGADFRFTVLDEGLKKLWKWIQMGVQ